MQKIKCFVINGGSEARKQGVKELEMLISTKVPDIVHMLLVSLTILVLPCII